MSQTILVPIDLEQKEAIDLIMPQAVDLARQRQAKLRLMTVLPDITAGMAPYVPENYGKEKAQAASRKRLQDIGETHVPTDVEWQADAVVGRMPRTIIAAAEQVKADLIVLASHDPTVMDRLLGSVSDQVMRRAHCSVMVVRASRNS